METEAKSSLFLSDKEINQEIEIRNDNISILQRKCHQDIGDTFGIATVEANLDCCSNHQKSLTVEGSESDQSINQTSDNNKDISDANKSRESLLHNESRYQQSVKQSISKADNLSGISDSFHNIDLPADIIDRNTHRVLNLFSDCNDKSSASEPSEAQLSDILNFIEVNADNISASVAACTHLHAKRTAKSNSEATDKLEKRNFSMMDKVPDGSEVHVPSSEQLLIIVSSSVEALSKTDDVSDCKSLDSGESLSLYSGDTSALYCVHDNGNEYTAVYKDYLKQEIENEAQISTSYSCNENFVEDELLAELENEFLSTAEIISLGENPDSSFQCRTLTSKLGAVQRRLEHTLSQRKELEVENVRLEQKLAGAIKNMESMKLELESIITTHERDNDDLKAKIDVIEEKAREGLADMQNEHQHTIEQLTKLYEDCMREKDAVVVRYAQAEQKNIDVQDRLQRAETRVKEWTKEREIALVKWHAMKTDLKNSTELNQTLAAEVSSLRKEVEKYKELASSADVKVKWQQNKLKAEQDVLKEAKTKLQEVEDRVKELKQEEFLTLDQIRSLFLILQEVDDGKIPVEIMQKKELSDIDELLPVIRKGLRLVEMKERELVAELKTLRDKVCCLEVERLSQEQSLNCIKDDLYNQQQGNMDLQDRILKLEKAENIMHERERLLRETVIRVTELESVTLDQRVEIEQFMKREAEQLEFTSRISDKNTHLVAANLRVSSELFTANHHLEEAELQCTVLKEQNQNLTEELAKQRNKAAEDARSLMDILEREQLKLSDVQLKLEEVEDEMKTIKRRHASNIKDLTRQLQIANRHVFDGKDFGLNVKTERDNASLGSLGSQGGSSGSLDTAGLTAAASSESPVQCEERKTEEHGSKESLLEKIGSLEKTVRHKCEKIEFLQDHVDQLIEELHRKSRIIQGYVLREEAGTLVPESSDKNKAQLAKKGGVMASLYASHALDGSMTMGLSLEINRKLQALLEDTLLKNMKLKEGMDTLGQEIDWLSHENKRLRHELERTADQSET